MSGSKLLLIFCSMKCAAKKVYYVEQNIPGKNKQVPYLFVC
jgi:hypothetical protein